MCVAAGITECHDVVISDVVEGIKSGCWREPVGQVRKAYDRAYKTAVKEANPDPYKVAKDAVNSLKKRLPGVTPSGRFASAQAQKSWRIPGFFASISTKWMIRVCSARSSSAIHAF